MNMLTKLSQSSHDPGAALSALTAGRVVFVLQRTKVVENRRIQVLKSLSDDVLTQGRVKQTCVGINIAYTPGSLNRRPLQTVVHIHE